MVSLISTSLFTISVAINEIIKPIILRKSKELMFRKKNNKLTVFLIISVITVKCQIGRPVYRDEERSDEER